MAKISDFGLTRASAKSTLTTMMTERVVGTRAYMAPEALRGHISPKSDVFSFGVVGLLQTHKRHVYVHTDNTLEMKIHTERHKNDEDNGAHGRVYRVLIGEAKSSPIYSFTK